MHDSRPGPADYVAFAVSLDYMRETLRAMVAGLIEDGFSEEQAREITTAIMSRKLDDDA